MSVFGIHACIFLRGQQKLAESGPMTWVFCHYGMTWPSRNTGAREGYVGGPGLQAICMRTKQQIILGPLNQQKGSFVLNAYQP